MAEEFKSISPSREQRRERIAAELARAHIEYKNPDIAFVTEFLGGLIGLLGLGYLYVGLVKAGLLRLVGFWVLSAVVWLMYLLFVKITLGIGVCLFFVPLALHIGAIYISADDLRRTLRVTQRALGE